MPHQVIYSATGKRFYGSTDLSTLFKFLARFFSVCVIFVSSWQISDNLMLLEIYICYVILNICLAPFYFLMLKSQIVSGLGLNKICAYTCCHILRGCPFFGEHFYLWTNVFRVTYMRYLIKKESCEHKNSYFIYSPPVFNKTNEKCWNSFQPVSKNHS